MTSKKLFMATSETGQTETNALKGATLLNFRSVSEHALQWPACI